MIACIRISAVESQSGRFRSLRYQFGVCDNEWRPGRRYETDTSAEFVSPRTEDRVQPRGMSCRRFQVAANRAGQEVR